MKRLIIVLFAVLFSLSVTACGNNTEESSADRSDSSESISLEEEETETIIGSWECVDYKGAIYTFNSDGTGSYTFEGTAMEFTYTDNGDSVELKYTTATVPSTHKYTIDGNKLLIEDSFGSTVTYKKTN